MKIDAHQHFWRYSPESHNWITPEMQILKQDYLPPDLEPLLIKSGYSGCVAVQAAQTEDETTFLLNMAERYSFIKGVVGWVDLQAENAADKLDLLIQNRLLKGVRHIVQSEPDRNFLLQSTFRKGIALLQPRQLTYDILIYAHQLPVAVQFVAYYPDQKFVVDHVAKPDIKNNEHTTWAKNLKKLALHQQVYCKLSGLVTEANWASWKPQDIVPYLETALEVFGTKRIMVGSDWPVCRLAGEYAEIMKVKENFISNLTKTEQADILGYNAINFYNL